MKKYLICGVAFLMSLGLVACGASTATSDNENAEQTKSTEQAPKKSFEITNMTLSSSNNKAYVNLTGKQSNYTADEFKWAWGLMDENGDFVDGKENPAAEDYKAATFNASGSFTVKYCLTDITTLKAGTLYRVYGGAPGTYKDLQFPSNNTGASDATRKYYLRSDKDNSLVFDNIQPISFTKASVVEVAQANLPAGITHAGAYLKFGGANSKNLTTANLDALKEAGNIAGNFQRVIGDLGYDVHNHVDEERFYKIEDNEVYFYCYIGFIEPTEGWMVHFDLVSGNNNANLQFDSTINGETTYTVGTASYKVYADKNKGGEENYWGCLGVYRVASKLESHKAE